MGSIGHVAHRIPLGVPRGVAGATVAVVGLPITVIGTIFTTIHHVAFVSSNDHPVDIRSEGPDECIYIVLHPSR